MEEIEGLINEVNHKHGTQDWQPIRPFMENNYTQAIAGMKLYDVLLVNPIIDGMNLVAKEGPVVNTRDGVVVLSETSGAYNEMAGEALAVAPTDVEGTTDALYQAITMSSEERRVRAEALSKKVQEWEHPALAHAAIGRHWELALAVEGGGRVRLPGRCRRPAGERCFPLEGGCVEGGCGNRSGIITSAVLPIDRAAFRWRVG